MQKNSDVQEERQVLPYEGCPYKLRAEGNNIIEHIDLDGFKVIERDNTEGVEHGSISK